MTIGFRSKVQVEKFKDMEARGEIKAGTTKQWADATPNLLSLPVRLGTKKPSKPKKRVKTLKKNNFYYS